MPTIDLCKWRKSAISVNCSFLARHHQTTSEALKLTQKDPSELSEIIEEDDLEHIKQSINFYLSQNNYSCLLLTYATFEEMITKSLADLKTLTSSNTDIKNAKGKNEIEKYRYYIENVCGISPEKLKIEWGFFNNFNTIRNFIIHANGNLSNANDKSRVKAAISQTDNLTKLNHAQKLIVEDNYIYCSLAHVKSTCFAINDHIISKLAGH